MELTRPAYYDAFTCIAGACPDSCCHEWEVEVDGDAAARYRELEGPLGDALRKVLYDEDGHTYMRNERDRCPMWRQDGLCRIQAELGHEALCRVCQQFPRLTQDYGSFVELGLEMSCPEAARIMLTEPDWTMITAVQDGGEEPDYDMEVMEILRNSRPGALALLEDRRFTVSERIAIIIMYGYHIQAQIDGGEPEVFSAEDALLEAKGFAGEGDIQLLLDAFRNLEILTERWQTRLSCAVETPVWDEILCKLAKYLIYRYYFQAVSDYDLVSRIKLTAVSCIVAAFLSAGDFEERLALIQLYSKEIENDVQNVEALLDGAYTDPGLTDRNLLGLLVG